MAALRHVLSSQWPVGASALLHGGVLALLLWQMSAPPLVVPESGQLAMTVDLVMAEAPVLPTSSNNTAAVTETTAIDPAPAPPTEVVELTPPAALVEESPSQAVEETPVEAMVEPPPPIETSVAEIVVPPPQPSQAKPEKPVVRRQAAPPPKPAVSPPAQSAALEPPGEHRSALLLPPPGAMMPSALPQQTLAAPMVPAVPIGPPIDYVSLIRAQLERFKQYPRVAQQRRLEGEAMLTIIIDRGGRVLAYRLVKGTGHVILDREVEEMVKRASPLPPIPARMQTDRLEIVVPVEFSLDG